MWCKETLLLRLAPNIKKKTPPSVLEGSACFNILASEAVSLKNNFYFYIIICSYPFFNIFYQLFQKAFKYSELTQCKALPFSRFLLPR